MCVYTADIYDSRSDRFDDIYHEINVKNHSSANSLQVPYFLIRRAAKKVTFIANMRTDLCVCECVCILPIYTIGVIPDRREPYRRVPLGRVHLDERRLDEVQ